MSDYIERKPETINENIRNALTPIVNLIELLKSKDKFDPDIYNALITNNIKSVEFSVEILKSLGCNSIEPADSEYFKITGKNL